MPSDLFEAEEAETSHLDAFVEIVRSGKYWLGVSHGLLAGWYLGVVLLG